MPRPISFPYSPGFNIAEKENQKDPKIDAAGIASVFAFPYTEESVNTGNTVKNVFSSSDPRSILLKNDARNVVIVPKGSSDIRNEMPSLLAHVKVSERASNYNKVNTQEPDRVLTRQSFSKFIPSCSVCCVYVILILYSNLFIYLFVYLFVCI